MYLSQSQFFQKQLFALNNYRMEQIRFQIFVSPSYPLFKRWILEFIRPHPISIFNVPYSLGLTYLNRSIVGLKQLRDYKFWHNFRDSLSPICDYGKASETKNHYPLHCLNFKHKRQSLMQNIEKITPNFLPLNESNLTELLLYEDRNKLDNTSTFLLISVNWLYIINKTVW